MKLTAVIDEKTKISILYIGVIICVAFWSGLAYSVALRAESVNEKQDQKLEALSEMKTDIAVIRNILDNKKSK